MNNREVNVQTSVVFKDDWHKLLTSQMHNGQRAAVHVEIDPIDGKMRLTVFTDDGRGNGLPMFEMQLD